MLDILDVDPRDDYAIGELTRCLRARLKPTEIEDLCFVLDTWNRSLADVDRLALERYRRAQQRGAVTLRLLRSHIVLVARLSQTPEWQAVMRWRRRVVALEPASEKKTRRRRAA